MTRAQCFRWLALLGVLLAPATVRAADPPKETALAKAPADAEYYRSMLRMGETIDIIGKSQMWKQIWDEPALKEFRKKAFESLQGEDFAPVRKFFADPANSELPALAIDALSNEVFLYTGAGTGDVISLFQELAGGMRFGSAFQKLLDQGNADPTRARVRILLQSLSEKPERIRIPDLVIGFKVSDSTKVATQLKRIDPLLADALKETPLKDRTKRVKLGDDEFLVLTLDGSMIPWDKADLGQFEDKKDEFAPLMKHLKAMKVTVSLGVRQGYLLLCIGSSTDSVLKFGGAGPKLASRPEFKPLAQAAGKPLTSISYASAKLRQAVATSPEDITEFADGIKGLIGQAGIPADLAKSLNKDLDDLAKSIGKTFVKPEATVSFSVRTKRGWETFDYDYTPTGGASEKPLTLLNHVGGTPILAAVWRSQTTVEDYRAFVKWVTVLGDHGEKIARAKFPDAEPVLHIVRKDFFPLFKELSDITEKYWLPALADGQEGFVIDAKWTSKRWHQLLPEADRELPLPEFGVILGVSDADKLGQALEGYRVTINKLIAKVREIPGTTIPEFEIPKPKLEPKGGSSFAFYPIPEEWGIDKQFQPTGGVSGSVAALALSRSHVERLLSPLPLQSELAPLANLKRPMDSAFVFNFAELISAAGPWVGYAIDSAQPMDKKEAERIAVKVMSMLKVFQSYGSVTYRENGVTVTHSEVVFRDLPPIGK